MSSQKYCFVMIDGPDGVGKGTLASAAVSFIMSQGKEAFDLHRWWLKSSWHPPINELTSKKVNVLVSAEPTYVGIGREIRNEIISGDAARVGRKYTAGQTAQAYALDRAILYQSIIIPTLKAGLAVIQERGFPASLVYQPIQAKFRGEKLSLEDVKRLDGNQLAMKYAPSLLLIPTVNMEVAAARMSPRTDKDIFESAIKLQEEVRKFYVSQEFRDIFEGVGTEVRYLDAGGTPTETAAKALEIIGEHLKTKGVLGPASDAAQRSLSNF
jgi:thymidylate kinase